MPLCCGASTATLTRQAAPLGGNPDGNPSGNPPEDGEFVSLFTVIRVDSEKSGLSP